MLTLACSAYACLCLIKPAHLVLLQTVCAILLSPSISHRLLLLLWCPNDSTFLSLLQSLQHKTLLRRSIILFLRSPLRVSSLSADVRHLLISNSISNTYSLHLLLSFLPPMQLRSYCPLKPTSLHRTARLIGDPIHSH